MMTKQTLMKLPDQIALDNTSTNEKAKNLEPGRF